MNKYKLGTLIAVLFIIVVGTYVYIQTLKPTYYAEKNSVIIPSDKNLTTQEQKSSLIREIQDSKEWNQSLENFQHKFLPSYYNPENPTLDTLYIYDISENGTKLKVAVVMINYHTRIRDDWVGDWVKKGPIWIPSDNFKVDTRMNIDTGKDNF